MPFSSINLVTWIVSHPHPDASLFSGPMAAMLVLCISTIAGWIWQILRAANLKKELADTTQKLATARKEQHELLDKSKKHQHALDEKRQELSELKQELSHQKRKVHDTQQEIKKVREDLRVALEERDHAFSSRPAFAEKIEIVPEKKSPEPAVKPQVMRHEKSETEEIKKLAQKVAELQEALGHENSVVEEHKAELHRLQRRAELLRRIDIVSKGKVELLEDKLRTMGRRYYDAVSELALIKGEVRSVTHYNAEVENDENQHTEEIERLLENDEMVEEQNIRQLDTVA